jgi:PAS domain S-box-containing protein
MAAVSGYEAESVEELNQRLHLHLGNGLAGWVAAHRQSVLVDDVTKDERWMLVAGLDDWVYSALSVPLVSGDKLVGALSFYSDRPAFFHKGHHQLAQSVAAVVAVAIQNAQLFQEAQRRAKTLAALHQTALDLAAQRALPDLLRAIVVRALDLLGAQSGGLYFYQAERDVLEWAVAVGPYHAPIGTIRHRGEGLSGKVWETGKPLVVDDYRHWEGRAAGDESYPFTAIVGVPIRWGERLLGVLNILGDPPRTFSPADVELLERFAPLAAAALEQARLLDEARSRVTELGILYDVATAATMSVHLDEILARTVEALRQTLQPDNVAILLLEPKTGDLIVRAAVGLSDQIVVGHHRVAATGGIVGWVAQNGQPLLVSDVRQDDRYRVVDSGTLAELCVPLVVRSRTIGVLNMESHRPGAFTEANLHLVSTQAGHLATVIENARLVQTLRESEARYRTLFEQANDTVHLETLDGRILDANAKACEMRGYSREELLTLTAADLVPPELRWQVPQAIEALLRTGVFRTESEDLCKDGTRIPVEVSSSLLRLDGQNLVMTVVRDIGERKRLEEQLRQAQKMEAIGTLAGGVAHDFNNLLGAILGYASLLERDLPTDSPLRISVDTIIHAAQRGAELTGQLLAFARGGRYEVRPTNLNDLVREAVQLLSRTVDKSIAIEPRLADDLAAVEGDVGQLHQMLLNLCINACDAMPAGGRLTIETENVTLSDADAQTMLDLNPGLYVWLRVTDTGIGMDPETMQRIFEPFFTTKKEISGKPHSGLGLAMVYGIVRSHGGTIRVHSALGQGTTFEVYLPAIGQPATPPMAPAVESGGGTETVLVVDDEVYILNLLKQVLESVGYTVLLAEDGLQALEVYQQRRGEIDLVVLDMGMPRLSGRETFRRLREFDSQAAVLISSGYAEDDQAREMLNAGARGFLAKPYNIDELLSRVREVLDRKP